MFLLDDFHDCWGHCIKIPGFLFKFLNGNSGLHSEGTCPVSFPAQYLQKRNLWEDFVFFVIFGKSLWELVWDDS